MAMSSKAVRLRLVRLPQLAFLGNVVDFDDGHSG